MMKKVLFVMLAVAGSIFAGNDANAQRIGVFDLDIMVQAMPTYRNVDSLVQLYERDSLAAEYDFSLKEYNRLDSTYKRDSADRKPASVLNYVKDQKNQIATNIIYWQQISQQKSQGKRQSLAGPLYEKIVVAYGKVLQANNYLLVLKPDAIEFMGSNKVENLFEKVAKQLGIQLPEQLRSGGNTESAEDRSPKGQTNKPQTNKPVIKPAPKK